MKKRKKYSNPPLVEAVCEFRLDSDTELDLTIPGMMYGLVKDVFPIKEQKEVQELSLQEKDGKVEQVVIRFNRIRFSADSRNLFMQMSPNSFSINCLQPYPNWGIFEKRIRSVLEKFQSIVKVDNFERIGLRYINRIQISSPDMKINDYFNFHPDKGPIKNKVKAFKLQCEFEFNGKRDLCRVIFSDDTDSNEKKFSTFILDIDYFSTKSKYLPAKGAMSWVNTAHDNLENIFEDCIKDETRKLFREEK